MMGDPKEAGAEASPPRAATRGGLSLLSQAESEEPSAQVSLRRGTTCQDPPGLEGKSWSFWSFLPRLLDTSIVRKESPGVPVVGRAGVCLQGIQSKTHLVPHSGVIDG